MMDVNQDDDVALIDGLPYLATFHTNPAGIPGTTHPCPTDHHEHASHLYSEAATECVSFPELPDLAVHLMPLYYRIAEERTYHIPRAFTLEYPGWNNLLEKGISRRSPHNLV
ncbi:hypothetical protein PIB30_055272 [Stylosanthes scabra]|uniref:Uncharacterized protein n=1 Tax=Stylosanthes scabra TaxID=79078 RepID=A0ABU6TIV0_9FABA|nr:hypothetical protein [Stylosanthes scabra]